MPSSGCKSFISSASFLSRRVKTFVFSKSVADVAPEETNLGKLIFKSLYPPILALNISIASGANSLPCNLSKV